jgi:hypothetical protein
MASSAKAHVAATTMQCLLPPWPPATLLVTLLPGKLNPEIWLQSATMATGYALYGTVLLLNITEIIKLKIHSGD